MNNITLIGMMAAGKTTVGKCLADKLNMFFIDTDELFEYEFDTVENIFMMFGESTFRKYESKVVKQVCSYENTVIATGGGAVLSADNMALLKNTSVIIYLSANIDTLYDRLKGSGRPLIVGKTKQGVDAILKERQALYEMYADIVVTTDNVSVKQVAKNIEKKLLKFFGV